MVPLATFCLSNYQYRTMGVAHYAFGGAAHEHVFPTSMTMGGDDNELAIELFGSADDFVPGDAESDKDAVDQTGIDAFFRGNKFELLLEDSDNARLFERQWREGFGHRQQRDRLENVE